MKRLCRYVLTLTALLLSSPALAATQKSPTDTAKNNKKTTPTATPKTSAAVKKAVPKAVKAAKKAVKRAAPKAQKTNDNGGWGNAASGNKTDSGGWGNTGSGSSSGKDPWGTADQKESKGTFGLRLAGQTLNFFLSGYADFILSLPSLQKFEVGGFEVKEITSIFGFSLSNWLFYEMEIEYEHNISEIKFEYAVLDLLFHQAFNVRVGLFLVPFNYFNEYDHPSPFNRIINRPFAMREIIPTVWRDAGIQLRGWFGLDAKKNHRLRYALFIGNGLEQTPSTYEETDSQGNKTTRQILSGGKIRSMRGFNLEKLSWGKAYGARMDLEFNRRYKTQKNAHFLLGASFYQSMYAKKANGEFLLLTMSGAYLRFDYRGFHVGGEFVLAIQNTEKGDVTKLGGYLDVAYRLKVGLEPVIRFELIQFGQAEKLDPAYPNEKDRMRLTVGLNWYIVKKLIFRADYELMILSEQGNELDHAVQLMLTWTF